MNTNFRDLDCGLLTCWKSRLSVLVVLAVGAMIATCPRASAEDKSVNDLADADLAALLGDDDICDRAELMTYLRKRHKGALVPARRFFSELDVDENQRLSPTELRDLPALIKDYLAGGTDWIPADPGPEFVPLGTLREGVNDYAVDAAVLHRHIRTLDKLDELPSADLDKIPLRSKLSRPVDERAADQRLAVSELMDATVMITSGEADETFLSGGVLVSDDGLVLTCYHVADSFNYGMTATTRDGRCFPVIEFLAGDEEADVALVRVAGDNFPSVSIAKQGPGVGDDLVMVHHTESRFYTYDRGYVMRYVQVGERLWMESALPYGPGGSGCGIFNTRHELVGIVSLVWTGSGPSLADALEEESKQADSGPGGDTTSGEDEFADDGDYDDGAYEDNAFQIVIRHAIPLQAIESLFVAPGA